MGRYTSEAISLSDLFSIQVEADDEAELEQKINSVITAVSILGEEFLVTSIEIDGSGRRARRKKDGQYVAIIEYSNSVSEGLDAAGHRVYCYATPALGRSGNGSAAALDSSRSAAYARATAEGYTDVRDTLFSGSSALRSKFLCALVVRGVGGIWAASASIYSRSGFREDQQLPELSNSRLRILTFDSGGYTAPISSDVGKGVVGASTGDTATLLSYDNTKRMWVVLGDDALDLFDEAESVSVIAGTGAGTTAGAAVLGYAPENTDPVPTSIQLSYLGSGVLSGTYRDGSRVACSVVGTYDVGTGALTFSGTGGDWAVSGAGTYSLSVLSVTTDVSRISGNSVETRTFLGAPGAQIDFGTEYYVDQVAGSDITGDGSWSNPYATLAKVEIEGFTAGDILRMARGTRVREGIIGGLLGITVEAYGVGPRPVADAFDLISAGAWQPDGTYPNVYYADLTPENDPGGGLGRFCVLEQGIAYRYVPNVATVASTPGSYYAPQTDGVTGTYRIYIQARASADPRTDGLVREFTSRSHDFEATGSSTFRSVMGRGCLHDNGGLVIRPADDANDTPLTDDCWQVWGGKHNFYDCGTKVGTESTHGTRRCVAFGWMPVNTTSSAFVSYRDTIVDQAIRPVHYGCAAIAHPQADVVTQEQAGPYISHLGGAPGGNWAAAWITNFGTAYSKGSFSLAGTHDKVLTNVISEYNQSANNALAHVIISGGDVWFYSMRIYNHVVGYNGDRRAVRADAAVNIVARDCITVMSMASNNAAWALQGTADIQRCVFKVANRSGTVRHLRSMTGALVLTQANNVFDSTAADAAWRLDVVGSATTSSDYNAVNAGLFVQESSGASARLFPVYQGDQGDYDQNSTSTMPAYNPGTDTGDRPWFNETAISFAARGFVAGPAQSEPGGAGWTVPIEYDEALVFINSLQ